MDLISASRTLTPCGSGRPMYQHPKSAKIHEIQNSEPLNVLEWQNTGWLIWYCSSLFGYFKHLELGCKVFLWLKFISCNGHLIICNVKVIKLEYMTRRNENVPKCQTWFFPLISKTLKIELKNYLSYSKSKACTYQITLDYQMSITWDGLDAKRFLVTFV